MDEAFAFFLKRFGPPIARRDVPPEHVARYAGRLPERLLSYWAEHGFAGYAGGLFWLVDPAEHEALLADILQPTPLGKLDRFHVVARTAFGELFAWGEKTGASLRIDLAHGLVTLATREELPPDQKDLAVRSFFVSRKKDLLDFSDDDDEPLFDRALAKLGPLAPSEVYGFVPALALGGKSTPDHLVKVDLEVHLRILMQAGTPRVIEPPPIRR